MKEPTCYHCVEPVKEEITFDERSFCCQGCKTVYEIFSTNNLSSYYEMQTAPGATPKVSEGKYDYLSNENIIEKLLKFKDGNTRIVSLYIPHIHCSSCIWILENLYKLQPPINSSQVDFPKKTVRITFNSEMISLQEVVKFLSLIGYEPYISLDDSETGKKEINRSLTYNLGVSGFAFGNVMFLLFQNTLRYLNSGWTNIKSYFAG